MGKEQESCRIIDVQQVRPAFMAPDLTIPHITFDIAVGYRPRDWITDRSSDGQRFRTGCICAIRREAADGTLIDENDQPLSPGAEPVFRFFALNDVADFNAFDFGEFLGEV